MDKKNLPAKPLHRGKHVRKGSLGTLSLCRHLQEFSLGTACLHFHLSSRSLSVRSRSQATVVKGPKLPWQNAASSRTASDSTISSTAEASQMLRGTGSSKWIAMVLGGLLERCSLTKVSWVARHKPNTTKPSIASFRLIVVMSVAVFGCFLSLNGGRSDEGSSLEITDQLLFGSSFSSMMHLAALHSPVAPQSTCHSASWARNLSVFMWG